MVQQAAQLRTVPAASGRLFRNIRSHPPS
jgi:hypothetical protein